MVSAEEMYRSLGFRSILLGSVFLLSGVVNLVFIIFPLNSIIGIQIGSADPILSFFLLLVGLIHLRGSWLLSRGRTEGLGHVLVAWFSGILIMVVSLSLVLASISEGLIWGRMVLEEIIDLGAITASFSGVLSILFSRTYRLLILTKGHGEEIKEVERSC